MKKGIWEKEVGNNASTKGLGPCNRVKRGVYAKERKGIFTVKRKERESTSVCGESAKKRVYLTFQVTPNFTSTFCGKKGWKMKDSIRLSTHKPVDNKKQIFLLFHSKYIG